MTTAPATIYVVARTRQQATTHLHLAADHWAMFDSPPRRRRARRPIPRVIILTPLDYVGGRVGPEGFAYIVGELCAGTPADADETEAAAIAHLMRAINRHPSIFIRRLWKTT